jgi:hypothetical protein
MGSFLPFFSALKWLEHYFFDFVKFRKIMPHASKHLQPVP